MNANNQIRFLIIAGVLLVGFLLMFLGYVAWGFGLHAALMLPLLWGTLCPNSRFFGPIQIVTGTEDLWLTLDDGPDPVDTPEILKLLKQHGVKATFFVIGEKADRYPELIQQIHDAGHGIGNHSWSHSQAWFWCHGPRRTQREIEKCQQRIKAITGEYPTLFRAPVGHHNIFVHQVLNSSGMKLVGWSSRGYDAVASDSEKSARRICESMQPGGIILAHEATPIAVDVVKSILEFAEQRDWKFSVPIGIEMGVEK